MHSAEYHTPYVSVYTTLNMCTSNLDSNEFQYDGKRYHITFVMLIFTLQIYTIVLLNLDLPNCFLIIIYTVYPEEGVVTTSVNLNTVLQGND